MAQTIADTARDQYKSFVARFDGTFFEAPIAGANKTFNAGIGLAEQVRTGFESKFNELAADGKKARDRAQKSAADWRKQTEKNVTTARKNVTKRVETALEKLLEYSPVATTGDVKKLNAKLDKVLANLAK